VTTPRPIPRYLGILVLLAAAGFAAIGFLTIRKDVDNLRIISQDNTQWSASQMEIELLRFRMALSRLRRSPGPEATEELYERFDILWSRVFMMGHGQVGESLRRYDSEHGSVAAIAAYLSEIDPAAKPIELSDDAALDAIEARLAEFQPELREYTLRVVRADGAAGERVRERIKASARTTAFISVAAVLISVLSLFLILRENRRQRDLVRVVRRSAEQAEQASRAKSRFLTMMSHELRNPLNGILGPLALLGQADLVERQRRLVAQAQNSGRSMLQMLNGMLDYGEVQDGRIHLRNEPFRVAGLADALQESLRAEGAGRARVEVSAGTPERVYGDLDRLRQIFLHLAVYMIEGRDPAGTVIRFHHHDDGLVGEICFPEDDSEVDWRLDLLMGLSEVAPDQVASEALRPLIARALIAATQGVIFLAEVEGGRRVIRVTVPARPERLERIRVHLETRSEALATIYRAALKSNRVVFVPQETGGPVDVVLVDSTTVGEAPLMARLRGTFPGALFVALGLPQSPQFFDDIVETPNDMTRLRTSILGRLAS
jgi:signal transduction histidine kinase